MSGSIVEHHVVSVRFVVYDPPATGLPWLSVCLGPNDEVIGVKPFASAEAAGAMNEACADRLARKYENAQLTPLDEHAVMH